MSVPIYCIFVLDEELNAELTLNIKLTQEINPSNAIWTSTE